MSSSASCGSSVERELLLLVLLKTDTNKQLCYSVSMQCIIKVIEITAAIQKPRCFHLLTNLIFKCMFIYVIIQLVIFMNIMSSSISIKYFGLQKFSFCHFYCTSFHLLNQIFLCFLQSRYHLLYAVRINIRSATQRILIHSFKENRKNYFRGTLSNLTDRKEPLLNRHCAEKAYLHLIRKSL